MFVATAIIQYYNNIVQDDHLSGKTGSVGEFDSCQGKMITLIIVLLPLRFNRLKLLSFVGCWQYSEKWQFLAVFWPICNCIGIQGLHISQSWIPGCVIMWSQLSDVDTLTDSELGQQWDCCSLTAS